MIIDSLDQMRGGCSNSFVIPSKKHNFDQFADVKVGRSFID